MCAILKKNLIAKIGNKIAGNFFEEKYYRQFYKNMAYPKATRGKVLMYAGIGHMYLTPLEILMYHLLRTKGFEVDYYIYDESVAANEVITKERVATQGKEKFWNHSVANAKRILNAAGVTYKFIKKSAEVDTLILPIRNDLEAILGFKYNGIDFGDIVKGVLYRYYKSLSFGDDVQNIAYNFLETALTNYFQVRQLHTANQYVQCFFSHGIYCTWQPVAAYCKQQQLRYVCYDRAKRTGSANFNINQPSPDWSFNAAWERYSDKKLTIAEEKQVSEYLGERELQKGDVYSYNTSKRAGDVQALKTKLGIPANKKVITIFTNLIWDAANVARDIAFPSALNCIIETIQYFKEDSTVQVVIRSHPAEKVLGTQERYGNLVRQAFNNQLPANVTIIEPEMEVNSFSVIDISDIGVVNTSTVGLEFAMMGKPILLISETNYRSKGFTYDAENKVHYFTLMKHLLQTGELKLNQVPLARKYFYMMMFLYQKQMPINYTGNTFPKYTCNHFSYIPQSDDLNLIVERTGQQDFFDFVLWN